MDENTRKFEIKIDPLDFHVGLKDNMAEFESLIRMNNPGKNLTEKIEKDWYADNVLMEEMAEAFAAYEQGDKAHCIQELAQCGAVILRIMETIENEMEEKHD